VDLLRRFNYWFGIFDEARCLEAEAAEPGENPFSSDQLVLCSTAFPARDERRFAQLVAAGWDLVIVDEAHHLAWSRDSAAISPEYHLVEQLAARTPGLFLLTATPTQLGPEGHFARLRLLDPDRYRDFARFVQETEGYGTVAAIAEKIVESRPLTATDQRALKKIFHRDPARLATHLTALGSPGSTGLPPGTGPRDSLLHTLLDQYGPGRVIFRNTRAAMQGFPRREYHAIALPVPPDHPTPAATLLTRLAREIEAEETGRADELRYNFKDDPRLAWLVDFLLADRDRKVLLICRNQRKVAALDAAIQTRAAIKTGLFHEGLPLVQRDRQAAWFAEPAGAQLLLCSEIGSEGRNFQFAHHLVLFDLPLNPGLVEQRIGRLDRIGQTETIRLHVPYLADSAGALLATWYHDGLAAFAGPLHGGAEFEAQFRERVLTFVSRHATGRKLPTAAEVADLLATTAAFRVALQDKLHRGRDRLLELASFDPVAAEKLLAQVRAAEADPTWRRFLVELLDHYGVRVKEHEDGDVFLNADHAYVEGFPAIPRDGMLATFDRRRAIAREDIRFVTPDHALVRDTLDLLLNSPEGSSGFGVVESGDPGLLLEAVFVLETVADTQWHVDQFLPPQPVRVVVNLHGADVSAEWTTADTAELVEDAPLTRFLERPGFNADLLRDLAATATQTAETTAAPLRTAAAATARTELAAEIERLRDLQKVNDHVRPAEVALAQARLDQITAAIAAARLRLDAVRLIVTGWDE
jgi:ATP-dependent helicase HepA